MYNASLFQVEMVPKWSERVVHFLTPIELIALNDTIKDQANSMIACHIFYSIER